MKIAAYTIALNEAKHAVRWARSCAEADVRLVADTGSTDGTVKLLRAQGVKVVPISVKPFRFEDARNAALALLPADIDICISLDMDEILAPGFVKLLRRAWDIAGPFERAFCEIDTGVRWRVNRMHGRQGYRWVAPCHEVAIPYPMREVDCPYIEGTLICHLPDDSKSRRQYLPLLNLAVQEQPLDFRMWAYLCREYGLRHQWVDVLETGKTTLELPTGNTVERASTYRWMAMATAQTGGTEDDVLHWARKATEEAPEEMSAWVALAAWSSDYGRHEDVLEAAERGLACEEATHYLRDDSHRWRLYDYKAVAAERLGRLDVGLEATLEAARIAVARDHPEQARLVANVSKFRAAWGRVPVSVIVPVWNGWEMTERCLRALESTIRPGDEIIVVNDGSTDETWERLHDSDITSYELCPTGWKPPNRGFAAACNAGAEAAKNPTLVFLNNDVVVSDGWLDELVGHLRDPEIVAAGPRTNYASGPQMVAEAPGLDSLAAFAKGWLEAHQGRTSDLERLVGFCLAVKADVFRQIGGFVSFNGSIGGYEDDDLCRRLEPFGRLVVAEGCFVFHEGHKTFDANGVSWQEEQRKAKVGFEKAWSIASAGSR